MIPKEILRKVRRLDIRTKKMVKELLSGEYHSVFKGRGMDFAEVREYQMGDDIRNIDWNVTARMNHAYVKVHEEERELTVILMVDVSSSGEFGTVSAMKREIAAEICALLAFSATENNDKVGLVLFTDKVEKYIPPKKGRFHVYRILRELLFHQPQSHQTDIAGTLRFLSMVTSRRGIVFLISDFISSDYEKPLAIVSRKHDLVAITITDPREVVLPGVGFVELEDAETGEMILLNTSDPEVQRAFSAHSNKNRSERDRIFNQVGVDYVDIDTARPYIDPLIAFFKRRAART